MFRIDLAHHKTTKDNTIIIGSNITFAVHKPPHFYSDTRGTLDGSERHCPLPEWKSSLWHAYAILRRSVLSILMPIRQEMWTIEDLGFGYISFPDQLWWSSLLF